MSSVLARQPHGEVRASFVGMISTLCGQLEDAKAHDALRAIFHNFLGFLRNYNEAPTCVRELDAHLTFLTLYCRDKGVFRAWPRDMCSCARPNTQLARTQENWLGQRGLGSA